MNILFFLTPKDEVAHVMENESLRKVLEKMEKHGYTAIPLLSKNGKYIGTITEGDLLWYLKEHDFPTPAEMDEVLITTVRRRRDNKAVHVHEKLEGLFEKAANQNFVPVVDDDKVFIGLVTRKDVLLEMGRRLKPKK